MRIRISPSSARRSLAAVAASQNRRRAISAADLGRRLRRGLVVEEGLVLPAKEGVVDGARVRLDVPREPAEHLAHHVAPSAWPGTRRRRGLGPRAPRRSGPYGRAAAACPRWPRAESRLRWRRSRGRTRSPSPRPPWRRRWAQTSPRSRRPGTACCDRGECPGGRASNPEPVERQAECVLRNQDMGDERRGQHAPPEELGRAAAP